MAQIYFAEQTCCIKFALYKQRTRGPQRNFHIKVDWETLQIFMKYRDKLSRPMAGPILSSESSFNARRITKDDEHSNPVISEFHRILWCGPYKAG